MLLRLFINLGIFIVITSTVVSEEFKVGVVPQFEQRRLLSTWTPILNYLEKETGNTFIFEGSSSIIEFESNFKAGKFDIAYCNPYHYIMAKRAQGYIPILRSGSKKLQGILVTAENSGVKDISALNGAKIAFPSPNALGASLLMRTELKTIHGLDIEPMYVKTHSSTYLFTAKGLVQAGGGVQGTLNKQEPVLREKLQIIYKTQPVNPHPVILHPRLSPETQSAILNALLKLAQEQATIFEPIPMNNPMQASHADYAELEQMGLENFVGQTER